MTFTLGFSPCPNDTFIFDAMVNGKIDAEGLQFNVYLEDVQTLNNWAIKSKLDITKLSYGVMPLVLEQYMMLDSGSALGKGVGPLLIAHPQSTVAKTNVEECLVAIPGENTTAHLLFSMAYPHAKKKIFMRYNEIEDFVQQGKGAGVIIHENRFTYEAKGLQKIIDLGDFWEKKTKLPLPLGGIAIRRNIDNTVCLKINNLIKRSIQFAFSNYPVLNEYIRKHAQEMSEEVMRKHIQLYVNNYSLHLGNDGKAAIENLLVIDQQKNKNALKLPWLVEDMNEK